MSSLLYRGMTKGTIAKGDQMKFGLAWAFARRGLLKVFDDHLECGDWRIDYPTITESTLFSVRSLFFIPSFVLRIRTGEMTYHFGLNGSAFWQGELPFPVKRENGSLGYSTVSIVFRVIVLFYVVLFLWRRVIG